jgi:crotonobetaine/carnitine-CoA ligase
MPAETLRAWRGLWHHTGDRCRLDHEGHYWFCGRAKEVIRRRGENVSIWELESVVGKHPNIAELAAVALPVPGGDEEIVLVVKPSVAGSLAGSAVKAFCEKELPRFMQPDTILIRDEDLPKTQSGKVDRIAVRSAVLDQSSRAH